MKYEMNTQRVAPTILRLSLTSFLFACQGQQDGRCYENSTCDPGLKCWKGTCERIDDGKEGGRCFGNQTCHDGLSCSSIGYCEALETKKKEKKCVEREKTLKHPIAGECVKWAEK